MTRPVNGPNPFGFRKKAAASTRPFSSTTTARFILRGKETGKEGGIFQSEIDINSGKLSENTRMIWAGTGGIWPEGPHLYKIGKIYYLMIAEGGTSYGHMETIARSQSPWGPFEPCPHNPILTHKNRSGHPIQATGHADLVQAKDMSWWLVFLGIRPQDGNFHHLGRETFLAPVTWDNDGWPVVNEKGTAELSMPAPSIPKTPWKTDPPRDDFNSIQFALCWNFLRNPDEGNWTLSDRSGWLRLKGTLVSLNEEDSPAFVGRRQEHFKCKVSALIEFNPRRKDDALFFCLYLVKNHILFPPSSCNSISADTLHLKCSCRRPTKAGEPSSLREMEVPLSAHPARSEKTTVPLVGISYETPAQGKTGSS